MYTTVRSSSFVFRWLLHFLYADHSTSGIENKGSYDQINLMGNSGIGTTGFSTTTLVGGRRGCDGFGWGVMMLARDVMVLPGAKIGLPQVEKGSVGAERGLVGDEKGLAPSSLF